MSASACRPSSPLAATSGFAARGPVVQFSSSVACPSPAPPQPSRLLPVSLSPLAPPPPPPPLLLSSLPSVDLGAYLASPAAHASSAAALRFSMASFDDALYDGLLAPLAAPSAALLAAADGGAFELRALQSPVMGAAATAVDPVLLLGGLGCWQAVAH